MKWVEFLADWDADLRRISRRRNYGFHGFADYREAIECLILNGGGKVRFMLYWPTPLRQELEKYDIGSSKWFSFLKEPTEIVAAQGHGGTLIGGEGNLEIPRNYVREFEHYGYLKDLDSMLTNGLVAGGFRGSEKRNRVYMTITDSSRCHPQYEPPYLRQPRLRKVPYPPRQDWNIRLILDAPMIHDTVGACEQALSAAVVGPLETQIPPQCIKRVVDRDGVTLFERPTQSSAQAVASAEPRRRPRCQQCYATYIPGTVWCLNCESSLPAVRKELAEAPRKLDEQMIEAWKGIELKLKKVGGEKAKFRGWRKITPKTQSLETEFRTWCSRQYKRTTMEKGVKDENGEIYYISEGPLAFRNRCERDHRFFKQCEAEFRRCHEDVAEFDLDDVDSMCELGLKWRMEAQDDPMSRVPYLRRQKRFPGQTVVEAPESAPSDLPVQSHPQYEAMAATARRRDDQDRVSFARSAQHSESSAQAAAPSDRPRRSDRRSYSRERSRRHESSRETDRRDDRRDDRREERRPERYGDWRDEWRGHDRRDDRWRRRY